MRAYDACKFLVDSIGPRWIGSEGETRAGDWIETEFRRLGLDTRRLWFDCPAWDYRSTRLTVDGVGVDAGAQMFSPACDVDAPLVRIASDGSGRFTGDVAGKIALTPEEGTGGVLGRSRLLANLKASGALAVVAVSTLPRTWSTKLFRDPKSDLPAAAVGARDGAALLAKSGARAHLVIDARPRPGRTSVVIGETGLPADLSGVALAESEALAKAGPEDAPVVLVGAHYDAAPYSPGAEDNAAGVGILMDLAARFAVAPLPRRTRFCAFSGHEFGGDDAKAFGSKSYVRACAQELSRVELMLNLDGVGATGAKPQLGVCGGPQLLERVHAFARRFSDVVVARGPTSGSDHGVFVEAGIEAVWLHSSGSADYDAQAYHSPLDDLRWVGEAEIARAADVAFALLSDLMK